MSSFKKKPKIFHDMMLWEHLSVSSQPTCAKAFPCFTAIRSTSRRTALDPQPFLCAPCLSPSSWTLWAFLQSDQTIRDVLPACAPLHHHHHLIWSFALQTLTRRGCVHVCLRIPASDCLTNRCGRQEGKAVPDVCNVWNMPSAVMKWRETWRLRFCQWKKNHLIRSSWMKVWTRKEKW